MDLSQSEWDAYVRALSGLRDNGVLARYVEYHNTYQAEAHGGCYFLPWHRQYLFELERELQAIVPGVSIPYWDWTKVVRGQEIYRAFSNDPVWNRMGGANGASPIPNPPFRGWSAGGRTCTRNFRQNNGNVGGGGATYTFWSSQDIYRLTHSSDSFSNFGTMVENIHGSPHVAIGGNMGSIPSSPLDPMFWSHHSFIDKMWRDWQDSGNLNAFGGIHRGRDCVPNGQQMLPFGLTVAQMFSQTSDCTTYASSGSAGPISRFIEKENFTVRQRRAREPCLTLNSPAEKERYLAQTASKKRGNPDVYNREIEIALETVDTMRRANIITNMPAELIEKAVQFYQTFLLKNGIDIVGDKGMVSANDSDQDSGSGHASASNNAFSFSQEGF
jgi:hypothetical protein